MTLRRTIAAALLKGGYAAVSRVAAIGPRPLHPARVRGGVRVALIAIALADLLDPDAHTAAAGADHDARSVAPAAKAAERGGHVEQPARSAAADAQGGHAGEGTRDARLADLERRVAAFAPLRMVKGGRA